MAVSTKLEHLREIALEQGGPVAIEQAVEQAVSHVELSTVVARDRLARVAHPDGALPRV